MIQKLNDIFYLNLSSELCEVHSSMLGLAKPWQLVIDTTGLTADSTSAKMSYVSRNNSLSSFYNVTMMKLYSSGAINDFNGYNKINVTYATSETINYGKIIPISSSSAYTMDLSNICLINVPKKYYGDEIKKDTLAIYDSSGNRMFYTRSVNYTNTHMFIEPDSNYFAAVSASLNHESFYGWCLPDHGLVSIWSTNATVVNALTASIHSVNLTGVLYNQNTTVNIVIQPDEYNTTTNPSFMERNTLSADSIANTTYITSVGLWNDYGDLLVVAKPAHPIRKHIGVPLSIKLEWWS